MSLSPVIGTEVPETPNGDVTSVSSENGPHVPVSGKFGESRVPCSGEESEDGALGQNHVDIENRVYDGEGQLDTETYNNERTSSLSSYTSHVTEPSGDSDSGSKDTHTPEAESTAEPASTPLLLDFKQHAHSKDLSSQGGSATCDRQQTDGESVDGDDESQEEEEEEDGEKEKQDEEDDEKNEKKWKNQHAGGRTEMEVNVLSDYSSVLDYVTSKVEGIMGMTVHPLR